MERYRYPPTTEGEAGVLYDYSRRKRHRERTAASRDGLAHRRAEDAAQQQPDEAAKPYIDRSGVRCIAACTGAHSSHPACQQSCGW